MRQFLTILEGPSPSEAKPILATEDRRLIRLVAAWIVRRLHLRPDEQDSEHHCDECNAPGGNDASYPLPRRISDLHRSEPPRVAFPSRPSTLK